MKKRKYIALVILLFLSLVVNAQIVPPPIPPPPPPGLSVDGGLFFLVISGLIYGVKKLKRS